MKALSIRQPWTWAILNAGKRCENRGWDPNGSNVAQARRLVGSTIFLHAGKGCTLDEYEGARDFMADRLLAGDQRAPLPGAETLPALGDLPRGFLVARALLVGLVRTSEGGHRWRWWENRACLLCGGNVPSEDREQTTCPKAAPWAIPGCLGLILADVVPLAEPVPFKGALGFFEVDEREIDAYQRAAEPVE